MARFDAILVDTSGWIDHLALDYSGAQAGRKKKETDDVRSHVVGSSLESLRVNLDPHALTTSAGRSPDLRIDGPTGLPVPLPEQWRLRSVLRVYSSGAVLDSHQLPEHQRNFDFPQSVH